MNANTEAQHTPEPWNYNGGIYDGKDDCYPPEHGKYWLEIRAGEDDDEVAVIVSRGHQPTDRQHADARRIVACVNACKGVPTEALERDGGDDYQDRPETPTEEIRGIIEMFNAECATAERTDTARAWEVFQMIYTLAGGDQLETEPAA